jgi:hypothetical protein
MNIITILAFNVEKRFDFHLPIPVRLRRNFSFWSDGTRPDKPAYRRQVGTRFMLHLYQEIREVSKTIPDAIVKNYLNLHLNALVISSINIMKRNESKY